MFGVWWTDEQPTEVYLKMVPCFDGFHDSVEIYSKLPVEYLDPATKRVTDLWTAAVLYNIGGSVIHFKKWYQTPILWMLKLLANSPWGQQYEQDLRQRHIADLGTEAQQKPRQEVIEL